MPEEVEGEKKDRSEFRLEVNGDLIKNQYEKILQKKEELEQSFREAEEIVTGMADFPFQK